MKQERIWSTLKGSKTFLPAVLIFLVSLFYGVPLIDRLQGNDEVVRLVNLLNSHATMPRSGSTDESTRLRLACQLAGDRLQHSKGEMVSSHRATLLGVTAGAICSQAGEQQLANVYWLDTLERDPKAIAWLARVVTGESSLPILQITDDLITVFNASEPAVLSKSPLPVATYQAVAKALLHLQAFDRVREWLAVAEWYYPEDVGILTLAHREAYIRGDAERGLTYLYPLYRLKGTPEWQNWWGDGAAFHFALGNMLRGVSKDDPAKLAEAIVELEKAVALQPDAPRMWLELALAYEGNGQVLEARCAYEQSLAFDGLHESNRKLAEGQLARLRALTDDSCPQPVRP